MKLPTKGQLKSRISRWLKRYVPAEITAIIFCYIGYFAAGFWFSDIAVLAYASAWSETISYYAVIIIREYRSHKSIAKKHSLLSFAYYRMPKLFLEFGPSEFFDSLVIRPLCIGLGIYYWGPVWGILLGKLISDIFFYVPVIITYEINCYFDKKK